MKRWWLWAIVGVVAMCGLCTVGTLVLGLVSPDDDKSSGSGSALATGGSPGAEGGFALSVPATFTADGQGRWIKRTQDGSARLTVELIKLPAIAGVEGAPEKLAGLWASTIGRDWSGVSNTPFILRRFVSNGARAHFTGAQLTAPKTNAHFFVTLYLVEAGDRLEPLVFVQGYDDDFKPGLAMMQSSSWGTTYPSVEEVLAGVSGSPVGLPLVSDDEVEGQWVYSTNNTAQWINTITGSTSMTAVAYSVDYGFDSDHRYTYKFNGASGQVGAMKFGSEKGSGEWKVEHDLLVLTGDDGKVRKNLITNAAVAPDGKRTLLLMSEGSYTLAPFGQSRGELYVERK